MSGLPQRDSGLYIFGRLTVATWAASIVAYPVAICPLHREQPTLFGFAMMALLSLPVAIGFVAAIWYSAKRPITPQHGRQGRVAHG